MVPYKVSGRLRSLTERCKFSDHWGRFEQRTTWGKMLDTCPPSCRCSYEGCFLYYICTSTTPCNWLFALPTQGQAVKQGKQSCNKAAFTSPCSSTQEHCLREKREDSRPTFPPQQTQVSSSLSSSRSPGALHLVALAHLTSSTSPSPPLTEIAAHETVKHISCEPLSAFLWAQKRCPEPS